MEESNTNWWMYVLIIALVWALFFHENKYEGRTAEEWFNEYDNQLNDNEQLKSALEEANSNIEEANDNITGAQYYAWESYEEMGDALDNLNTVDTVSEP